VTEGPAKAGGPRRRTEQIRCDPMPLTAARERWLAPERPRPGRSCFAGLP